MNVKPFGKKVTIRPISDPAEEGVYVPDELKKKISKGEVVGIGEEVKYVKVGDVVLFSPVYHDEITEELLIVEEVDIWGAIFED